MERYIGLDPHGTSCTFGVIGPSGRKLRSDVVETNGGALVSYLRSIPGRKHLCLEEGTQSAWLYEILSPHVEEIVVAGVRETRGQKSDLVDAFQRAEELRTGTVKKRVFKAPRLYSRLRELGRVHSMLVRDVVRVQARLKSMYRARGVTTPGKGVYGPKDRDRWLRRLPVSSRWATEKLHEQYDLLPELKRAAERELVSESRKHRISRYLGTVPGLGPIRVARLLPIVVTPHRFRTRSQFWAYCGLGIVMRSSCVGYAPAEGADARTPRRPDRLDLEGTGAAVTRILDRETFPTVVRHTPLVSIDLVVRDPAGRILLGLRNNRPARDRWFVPGGRICKDERLDDAFRRITGDELGRSFERSSATLLGAFEHLYADNVADQPDLSTHYVVLAHRIDVEAGWSPTVDDQHREYRWFAVSEASDDRQVHPNSLEYFRILEGAASC